jgi:hypothetical protein
MLMVMVRKFVVGLLILSGLAMPARADFIAGSDINTGNWSGGAWDTNGKFSHCVVQTRAQNGVVLYFSVASNYTWRVAWSHENWQLTADQTSPVTVWVDNSGPHELQGKAINKTLLSADLPYDNQTFDMVRRASRMSARLPDRAYYFDLSGSNAALDQLVACFNKYLAYVRPTAPPTTTTAPAAAPTAEQRAAAKRHLAAIVGQPEMTGMRILDAAEVQQRNSAYLSASDVVWIDDAVVGAMRVLPPGASTLQALVDVYIEAERKTCPAIQSGNTPDERGNAVLRAHTSCHRGNGVLEVRYIIVPRPDGTRYLFTTVGTTAHGAPMSRVRAGDAGLRQAIFAILRQ